MFLEISEKYKSASSFGLGDSSEMAESGLSDVISCKQVATCGAVELLDSDISTRPYKDKIEIVLDGSGQPGCAIKYTNVDIKRFSEIDEQFARDEACRDLEEWKSIHEAYFRRRKCFDSDMKLYLLYFDVVEVFESPPESEDNG